MCFVDDESDLPKLPRSLSPSSISMFRTCPLSFRYTYIDKEIRRPDTVHTFRGNVVHLFLQWLHADRTEDRDGILAGDDELTWTWIDDAIAAETVDAIEYVPDVETMRAEVRGLVDRALAMEDHANINAVGVELKLEVQIPDGPLVRGIIDRLDYKDGLFLTKDYKTGQSPTRGKELAKMEGITAYAYMVSRGLGVPEEKIGPIALIHLKSPGAIVEVQPSAQALRHFENRTRALWKAIETAFARDDFRPRTSWQCKTCVFQPQCPAYAQQSATA